MTATTKRANFDLSPEQEELLAHLRAQLAASSTKEAVLRAAQLTTPGPWLEDLGGRGLTGSRATQPVACRRTRCGGNQS